MMLLSSHKERKSKHFLLPKSPAPTFMLATKFKLQRSTKKGVIIVWIQFKVAMTGQMLAIHAATGEYKEPELRCGSDIERAKKESGSEGWSVREI